MSGGGEGKGAEGLIAALARLDEHDRIAVIKSLSPDQRRELNQRWRGGWAHRGQWPDHDDWRVWVIMAGRGFGKASALTGVLDDYRLTFESGDSMTGKFLVTRLDYAGDFNGERSYTLSLESSGPVVAA